MTKTTLPFYDQTRQWGMFGYSGFCCDLAVKRDDPAQAQECWQRGYMDYDTRMLAGSVGEEAERRAQEVAKKLKQLGPVQCEPMADSEFMEPVAA